MHKVIGKTLIPGVALLIVAAVLLRIVLGLESVTDLPRIERPWLLWLAVAALGTGVIVYASLWHVLLAFFERRHLVLLDSWAVFTCSWIGRYVPTSLPYVAASVWLGRRIGISPRSTATVLVYHNLFVAGISSAIGSAILATLMGGILRWVFIMIAIGSIAGLALVSSRNTSRGLLLVERYIPQTKHLREIHLSLSSTLNAAGVACVGAICNGAVFVLLLSSFVTLDARGLIAAGAAFNLAGAAGIAAVPIPSGIGVRELVLIGLLQAFVSVEVAAAAAVTARIMTVPVDLALGIAGGAWLTLRNRSAMAEEDAGTRTTRTLVQNGET